MPHTAEALVRELVRALEEARAKVSDIAERLDLPTVGQAKWELLRCGDAITDALRRAAERDGRLARDAARRSSPE